jgi:hypothetical protein
MRVQEIQPLWQHPFHLGFLKKESMVIFLEQQGKSKIVSGQSSTKSSTGTVKS